MPHTVQNVAKSLDANCGPLSVTSVSGRPWRANTFFSAYVVASVVVDDILTISGQLEYASISKNHILPSNGPAKSAWTRCERTSEGREWYFGWLLGVCCADGAGVDEFL
jgi:hypothetical protein